jgi:hypothetical protein
VESDEILRVGFDQISSDFVGQSDEIQRNPTKKSDPEDFIGFRNPDSDRISSYGRIRPDPIGPVSDSWTWESHASPTYEQKMRPIGDSHLGTVPHKPLFYTIGNGYTLV